LLLSVLLLLLFLQGLQQVPLLLLLLEDLGKPKCTTCTMQGHTCKVSPEMHVSMLYGKAGPVTLFKYGCLERFDPQQIKQGSTQWGSGMVYIVLLITRATTAGFTSAPHSAKGNDRQRHARRGTGESSEC
jgi:hypothetical protein